jgi:hypothetical protein
MSVHVIHDVHPAQNTAKITLYERTDLRVELTFYLDFVASFQAIFSTVEGRVNEVTIYKHLVITVGTLRPWQWKWWKTLHNTTTNKFILMGWCGDDRGRYDGSTEESELSLVVHVVKMVHSNATKSQYRVPLFT